MSKEDKVFSAFLNAQYLDAQKLNRTSDMVEIIPKTSTFCQLYAVRFFCKGMIKETGVIKEHDHFSLAVFLPDQYLRRCNPFVSVRWVSPESIWHPNIKPPFLCLGRVMPGMPIVDIVHQAFQIITYQKVTMVESDSLNREACAWARANSKRFPVDTRPLRRRPIEFTMEEIRKDV